MPKRVRYPISLAMAAVAIACFVVDKSVSSPETKLLVGRAFLLVSLSFAAVVGAGVFIEWRDKTRRPKDGPEADYYDPPPEKP